MPEAISIVGGGVAGLALGNVLAKRGIEVSLYETGKYPRHRVCGEFICGVSQETLQDLGLEETFERCRRLSTTSWFIGDQRIGNWKLPKPAIAVSRFRMDAAMADQFEKKGGILRCGERVIPGPDSLKPGYIWANGRQIASRPAQWLGLKVHFLELQLQSELELHIGRMGYIGLSPVEDGRVNVCGLFRQNRSIKGKGVDLMINYLEFNGLHQLAARLRGGEADAQSFCGVSALGYGESEFDSSVPRIGDAAGLIPPFTGNGMSMALESAGILAPLIEQWARKPRPWSSVIQDYQLRYRQAFRYRRMSADIIQKTILNPMVQPFLGMFARAGLLPFKPLYRITH